VKNVKLLIIIFYVVIIVFIFVFKIVTSKSDVVEEDVKVEFFEEDILEFDIEEDFSDIKFIFSGNEGVFVFDNKNNDFISNIKTGFYVNDGIFKDDYFYLVDRQGLKIFDISDIKEPVMVSSFNTFGNSLSIDIDKNFIFLADGNNGFVVFEVLENMRIRMREHINVRGIVSTIKKYNDYIILSGPGAGIMIYEEKEGNFFLVASKNIFAALKEMHILNDKLYVNDEFLGIFIYDLMNFNENKILEPEIVIVEMPYSIFPVEEGIFFSNVDGLYYYDFEEDISRKILESKNSRNVLYINDKDLFLLKRNMGFEKYSIDNFEKIFDFNIFNSVSYIKKSDKYLIFEDNGTFFYLNENFNIVNSLNYSGNIYKGKNNLYVFDGSDLIIINDVVSKIEFSQNILKIKETSDNVFVFFENNYYYDLKNSIFFNIAKSRDLDFFNDKIIYSIDNVLYEYSEKGENKKVFEFFNDILFFSNNEVLITVDLDEILFLNQNYEVFYYDFIDHKPDLILVYDDYLFVSKRNILRIYDLNNPFLNKEISLNMPIIDIEYDGNYVYLSFYSEGAGIYEIDKNLNLIEKEFIYFFNAYKMIK
jgi:hypothetical protein